MMKKCVVLALALLLGARAVAELQNVEVGSGHRLRPDTFTIETRIYQTLTSITGDGETSRTLPGMNGWLQVLHQRLDNVALAMDGATLTWDGQDEPDYPRIIGLGAPNIVTRKGEEAFLQVGPNTPTQYMRPAEEGRYALEALPTDAPGKEIGIGLSLTPKATSGDDRILTMDFSFNYSWIKERQKLEGVHLEVGEPILGKVSADGEVQTRLGEWSCYQSPVGSDGAIYVFIRVTEANAAPAAELSTPPAAPAYGNLGTPNAAAPTKGLKNIEVGGSMRLRWEHRTGRPKL